MTWDDARGGISNDPETSSNEFHGPRQTLADAGFVKADSQESRSRNTLTVLWYTVIGSLLFFVVLFVISTVWLRNLESSNCALDRISVMYRKSDLEEVKVLVARTLHQVWRKAQFYRDDLRTGGASKGNVVVVPPSADMFHDLEKLGLLSKYAFSTFDVNVWMTHGAERPPEREYIDLAGFSIALLFQADGSFSTTNEDCGYVGLVTAFCMGTEEDPYEVEVQWVNNGSLLREAYAYDGHEFGSALTSQDVITCVALGTTRRELGSHPEFGYFGWQIQAHDNRELLAGTVPVTVNGDTVGVASFFISLQHILCDVMTSVGGSFEFGAMYLDSEGVLGDSNMDETGCAAHLNELLLEVEAKYGQRCPGGDLFFTWKDTLVSVALMDLESYGIPPFSERVCVILTSPRSHIYGPADTVQETNIFVAACGVVAVVVSAAMLVSSLYVAMVVQRSVWQDRRDADMDQVRAAESALKELSYPMCIIEAKDFLKMITWHSHEHWRDSGILIILDTLQDIREFQQTRSIVFISHQWLGYSQPDTEDNLQMRAMQRAVAVLQRYTQKELYVWLDYLSVAQRHLGLQQMAVNALPVYVSVVNSFLICAPEATHRDTGLPCGFHSYSERGWCRMEMLAKACGSGTSHIYVCRGDGVYLEELAVSQMNCLSFNVYEGVFTKESDKEMLVLPTLGLYSRVLRKESDDMSMILMTMKAGINTFFPSHYIVELTDGTHQKRTLFGTVIRALEKHVQNTSDTTEGSDESTAGLSASLDAGRTWHLLDFDLGKETTPAPGRSSQDSGHMTQVLAV